MVGASSGATVNLRTASRHGVKPVHIIVPDFCEELKRVLDVAKGKAYQIPVDSLKYVNTAIQEWKANGIWALRDSIFLFGLNSPQSDFNNFNIIQAGFRNPIIPFSYIDLRNPSRIGTLVQENNSPWFNRAGLQNNPSISASGHFVTNYYPGAAGNKWQQNSASFSVYVSQMGDQSANSGGGQQIVGLTDSGATRRVASLVVRSSADATAGNINRSNNSGEVTFVASGVTEQAGQHSLDRSASNQTTYYKNGSSVATSAQASGTVPNNYPIVLMAQNVDMTTFTRYKRAPLSFFGAGASLGANLQKLDYQIFTDLRTKIGYK
jgi:hypothetical protein